MDQTLYSVSERPFLALRLTQRLDRFLVNHPRAINAVLYGALMLAVFLGALQATKEINTFLGIEISLGCTTAVFAAVWLVATVIELRCIMMESLYEDLCSPPAAWAIDMIMHDAAKHDRDRKSRGSRVMRRLIARSDVHRMWVSVLHSEQPFLRTCD